MTVNELYNVMDDAWIEVYEDGDEKLIYASWRDSELTFMPNNIKERQVRGLYAYTITIDDKTVKENVEIGDIVFWIYVY